MSVHKELMPIRTMAELTGVNSITLRAWERRYGLLKPLRTSSGHRLYSSDDLTLIEKILSYLAKGIAISQVKKLLQSPDAQTGNMGDIWLTYRQKMEAYITQFNLKAMDNIYNEALALYPLEIVADKLLLPLVAELAAFQQPGSIVRQRFYKTYVRNKLGMRLHHTNLVCDGPKLICSCFGNEDYELQLLLFALYLIAQGYQVIYLGSDLPCSELWYSVTAIKPAAIILAGQPKNEIIHELESLHLASATPLLLLGSKQSDPAASTGLIYLAQNCYQAVKQVKEIITHSKRKNHA